MTDEQMLMRLRRGPWNGADLNDVFGQADSIATVPAGVATDLGFTPETNRQLLTGIRNGDFAAPPPDTSVDIDDITNKLPDWSFVTVAGSSVTARVVTDSSAASGYVLRWAGAAGNANDEAYIEQIIPVESSRNSVSGIVGNLYMLAPSDSSSSHSLLIVAQYLDSDYATTGTASTETIGLSSGALYATFYANGGAGAPSDASYLRIRIGVKRDLTDSNTLSVDVADVTVHHASGSLAVADYSDDTASVAIITKSEGTLYIDSGHSGSDPGIVVGGAGGATYPLNSMPYGARASRTSNQSIADATVTSIDFNATDEWDAEAMHDTSTNNEKITLKMTGYWLISGGAVFETNATGNRTVFIELNGKDGGGTALVPFTRFRAATGDTTGADVTVVRHFTTSDTVALTVKQDSGGALNVTEARLSAVLLAAGS